MSFFFFLKKSDSERPSGKVTAVRSCHADVWYVSLPLGPKMIMLILCESWIISSHHRFLSCRSMNAYLIVYLCILISKALINTVLKYAWQASPNRDEPWYNQKTETERQRHVVRARKQWLYYYNFFILIIVLFFNFLIFYYSLLLILFLLFIYCFILLFNLIFLCFILYIYCFIFKNVSNLAFSENDKFCWCEKINIIKYVIKMFFNLFIYFCTTLCTTYT